MATEAFTEHRDLLFSMVYNLLGSIADTEDVLQETWLSWSRRTGPPVRHEKAYLVRIAVHHALARQAVISRRRETYVGPWLPEPLMTIEDAGDRLSRSESVSVAVLVVLETLSPLERAVFVLHEVFGYGHPEIAGILDRKPAAVRQIAHRAREHVRARRPRFPADAATRARVTERFVAAALDGDLASLMRILAPDVTLWGDGGGNVPGSARRPVTGRDRVARAVAGYVRRRPADAEVTCRSVNGELTVVVTSAGRPFAVLVLDLDGEQVRNVYAVANPEKLRGV